jgi:hypothetical protein
LSVVRVELTHSVGTDLVQRAWWTTQDRDQRRGDTCDQVLEDPGATRTGHAVMRRMMRGTLWKIRGVSWNGSHKVAVKLSAGSARVFLDVSGYYRAGAP